MADWTLEGLLTIVGLLAAFCVVSILLTEDARRLRAIMSRFGGATPPNQPIAPLLPATSTTGGQGIAKQGNAVNDELTGNLLPEAAREIIRFQAKVEDAAALVESGKIGQTEAIEIIFHCKRSGRADSPYGKARAAVLARLGPERPVYYDDLKERIAAETKGELLELKPR